MVHPKMGRHKIGDNGGVRMGAIYLIWNMESSVYVSSRMMRTGILGYVEERVG